MGHDRARKNAGGGIAGGRGHVVPTPLSRSEEKRIFDKITAARAAELGFEAGDIVRVREGIFQGNLGKIIEANHVSLRYAIYTRQSVGARSLTHRGRKFDKPSLRSLWSNNTPSVRAWPKLVYQEQGYEY